MTSRERVRRAVLFERPDKVPVSLPEPYGDDFLGLGVDPDPNWKPSVDTETRWEDEWGCIWEKPPGDLTMGQVRFHPLSDYSCLDDFRFPDYKIPRDMKAPEKLFLKIRKKNLSSPAFL